MQVGVLLLIGTGFCSATEQNEDASSCGGVLWVSAGGHGQVSSPGYPLQYQANVTCTWIIQAPVGEHVELTFTDFDITGSVNCDQDHVSISLPQSDSTRENGVLTENQRSGTDSEFTEIEGTRFCGSNPPPTLTSPGNEIIITFVSNAKGSCRGFNASFTTKEETVGCGATTKAREFTFASPSYPSSLPNASLECSLTVDHGCEEDICQIRLDFDEFEIQPPFWGDCKHDQFYASSGYPLPTLCGNNTGSHIYIRVGGQSKTTLTFLLSQLEYYFYNCYRLYDVSLVHQHDHSDGTSYINPADTSDSRNIRDHDSQKQPNHPDNRSSRHRKRDHNSPPDNQSSRDRKRHDNERKRSSKFSRETSINSNRQKKAVRGSKRNDDVGREKTTRFVELYQTVVPRRWNSDRAFLISDVFDDQLTDHELTETEKAMRQAYPATASDVTSVPTTPAYTGYPTDPHDDVTVALYNYKEHEEDHFPGRRAWKIRVTQIPCGCTSARVPKAPDGCLQYFEGMAGDIKSFNFDGNGCYSEDKWCDFSSIRHPSECDIRVGYTGHLNNLDYASCVSPEPGFCGVEYRQAGRDGFSLTSPTDFADSTEDPVPQFGDKGCMADYLWLAGVGDPAGDSVSYERYCGTQLGGGDTPGLLTSQGKPFMIRTVTDSDEFSMAPDYMNRGYHLQYEQTPCG